MRSVKALLDAQPGHPNDAEIWGLIRDYGAVRFVHQARIQVAIATETLRHHPECGGADRIDCIKAALPSLKAALFGCLLERLLGWTNPQMSHMQAMTAAEIFNYLCVDVKILCAPEPSA